MLAFRHYQLFAERNCIRAVPPEAMMQILSSINACQIRSQKTGDSCRQVISLHQLVGLPNPHADILYMTRVQRERFTDLMEYERVKNIYILRNKMLEHTRPNLRILHPLPRVNEIALDVDDNPKAYYFQQAQNGLYAREAILCDVLGITLDDVK